MVSTIDFGSLEPRVTWADLVNMEKVKRALPPSTLATYKPALLPKDMMWVYQACFSMANSCIPRIVFEDVLPMLAAVMKMLAKAEEQCELKEVPHSQIEEICQAINFLTEHLATLTKLRDPSAPSINMTRLQWDVNDNQASRSMMWDVSRGFARRVTMTKLVHLDADIPPYLAALMIATLKHHKETLKTPDSINYEIVPDSEW